MANGIDQGEGFINESSDEKDGSVKNNKIKEVPEGESIGSAAAHSGYTEVDGLGLQHDEAQANDEVEIGSPADIADIRAGLERIFENFKKGAVTEPISDEDRINILQEFIKEKIAAVAAQMGLPEE